VPAWFPFKNFKKFHLKLEDEASFMIGVANKIQEAMHGEEHYGRLVYHQ